MNFCFNSNYPSPLNNNRISNTNQQQSAEYNPLAGVSFKATHSSDVEIVGVKLGNGDRYPESNNNSIQQQQAQPSVMTRKKASLTGPNENAKALLANEDMLDIVGRGYNGFESKELPITDYRQQKQFGKHNNNDSDNSYNGLQQENVGNRQQVEQEVDYPLSLSFQSRLRQKTQEKIQEKMKRKDEVKRVVVPVAKEYESQSASSGSNNSHSPSVYQHKDGKFLFNHDLINILMKQE